MLNLGVRAHDFGQRPARELAAVVRAAGFSCVQLALPKALPGFSPEPGQVTRAVARQIRDAFLEEGIEIAVLGCYINPVHPDPAVREFSLVRFEELLRYARDFDCSVVATETGSLSPDGSFHPGTSDERVFDQLVGAFRRLAVTAEAAGVRIGIEGVFRAHTVSTHDRMERLINAVGSPALGVVYDPANFLPASEVGLWEASVADALDRFGSRLVAVHAKDCRMDGGNKTGDLVAGTGAVPYPYFLGRLQREHPGIPILVEDVNPDTFARARDFLLKVAGA